MYDIFTTLNLFKVQFLIGYKSSNYSKVEGVDGPESYLVARSNSNCKTFKTCPTIRILSGDRDEAALFYLNWNMVENNNIAGRQIF